MSVQTEILIVGAGVAGLQTAIELLKYKKDLKIHIVELASSAGGRMYTYSTTVDGREIHYDTGAGRIHDSHKLLHKLIKEYKLKTVPIISDRVWRPIESKVSTNDNFHDIWDNFIDVIRDIPEEKKRLATLREIAIETMGVDLATSLLETYPYRAEVEVMSADSAIDLFDSMRKGGFSAPENGFSSVIEKMLNEAEKLGATIEYNAEVQRIEMSENSEDEYNYIVSGLKNNKHYEWRANRVILALHKMALEKIYPFSADHPILKEVRMESLMRIYSVYKDASWFPEKQIITNSPLRYILPVDYKKGIIMSSYLDSRDIESWKDMHKKENNNILKQRIQQETQYLFPEKKIPEAEMTKAHFWRQGCSYWLPGDYDYRKLSEQALRPMPQTHPKLHVVGESFSCKQQWIEGALEHVDLLLKKLKEEYR